MRSKVILSLILVLAIGVAFAGCAGEKQAAKPEKTPEKAEGIKIPKTEDGKYIVTIYTGSGPGSVYFAVGSMFAKVLNKKSDLIEAKGVTSGASVANAKAIGKGEALAAIIQNDVTYYAWNGKFQFEGKPIKELRGIGTLYPEPVQIVVRADSDIYTLEDLRGKKVVVGAAGSGVAATAERVLKAAGVWDDIEPVYQTFSEAAQSLVLGQVDAEFTVIAYPAPAIDQIAVKVPVRLIPIPDEVIQKLHDEGYPFYVKVVVPANTYNGQTEDVQTIAVKATLAVHKDLPEEVVYEMTNVLYENIDELAKAHQVAKQIDMNKAFEGLMIPLHPGAVKYYEEKGIKVPENLR
ncbi:TRAP transporter solute receptor, TAXI family [Ferroglobus placidus DSM 10642]|uniref:TRAP transporter solute receptor, TAXI family n=1 Tax=Ferroglobus placidus (strain DSM 10642 / AEDII12DO) TaxID=589924 RepID=D3RXS7_FERPA|nr:TAXI family TRAP transporter solute-binding subunit [Ferroglobus placidus]ADC65290.1 TRAP transporter solute receptor, TAXI family [Ferroglobus placidus DSM 10642]